MEKSEFESLLKEIKVEIKDNKKTIDQALNKELSKGTPIKLDRIERILRDFENSNDFKNENIDIAVCYLGSPEITVTYILDSIMHNNKVTLCINENKIINDLLVNIILDSMQACKIKNDWINYNSNYNEIYLRDNEKHFSKIVYVGDYFEYERFKTFFKKDVEYKVRKAFEKDRAECIVLWLGEK